MDPQKLLANLQAFALCTATPGQGVTRFSWSAEDRKARQLLAAECRELGLEIATDGIGNFRARMPGVTRGPGVILGSHLDSVRNGGSLDGIYGVCAGLEVLRALRKSGCTPAVDVELVAFAEEEGSNFGCTCLGSKAVTGGIGLEDLHNLLNHRVNAWDCLRQFGLDPDSLPNWQFSENCAKAYLEVHIEQNRQLEKQNRNIGIVTAICGMRLYSLSYSGVADHAASPMSGRRDPMAAFAHFASSMESMCRNGDFGENYCCTIGKIECTPNVGIISPEKVVFTVDVRHVDVSVLGAGADKILRLASETAGNYGVEMQSTLLSASGGAKMDAELDGMLRTAAQERGAAWMDMVSGPAHDAACMAKIVPSALLFVPSINGLSHCSQESTRDEDLIMGAQILEDVTFKLAFQV